MAGLNKPQQVEPVFVRHKDLPQKDPTKENSVSDLDICLAAERVCGKESIYGTQLIKGLWRIYPLNRAARNKLLIEGMVINGCTVSLHDKNPLILRGVEGGARGARHQTLCI